MHNVEYKTSGYLISEYITIGMKTKYAKSQEQRDEAIERRKILHQAVLKRMQNLVVDMHTFRALFKELYIALRDCWNAQEIVMDSLDPIEVYMAAKTTLIKNKERNIAIRRLDVFFGEQYYSHLEKTYRS